MNGIAQQVFIVGCPRSGTSITMEAVRKILPEYNFFFEGHFIDILPHLKGCCNYFFSDVKKHYKGYKDFMLASTDQEKVKAVIVSAVIEYYKELAGNKFIEKTHGPAMIYALADLKTAFPKGRAILVQRRALEYMRSVSQKFTLNNWDENLLRWTECAKAAEFMKGTLGDFCLTLDHFDLVNNRRSVASKIAEHLGLGEVAEKPIFDLLSRNVVEKTPGTTFDPIDITDLGLSSEQEKDFREKTAKWFDVLGYSYDISYFSGSLEKTS